MLLDDDALLWKLAAEGGLRGIMDQKAFHVATRASPTDTLAPQAATLAPKHYELATSTDAAQIHMTRREHHVQYLLNGVRNRLRSAALHGPCKTYVSRRK
jgi:hypothetical protein